MFHLIHSVIHLFMVASFCYIVYSSVMYMCFCFCVTDLFICVFFSCWCIHQLGYYCAVRVLLLTPLNFLWHHWSPLVVFTSSVYFLHNGRRWQWTREVYSTKFKGIFESLWSECVWQQARTCCSYRATGCQKMHFFPSHLQSSGQPKTVAKSVFPPFPCNSCKCYSSGVCTALQFQLPLLYVLWRNAYSELSPEVAAGPFRDFLRERLWRVFTHANQLHRTAQ